MQGVVPPVVG
jgi:hypothetical protein